MAGQSLREAKQTPTAIPGAATIRLTTPNSMTQIDAIKYFDTAQALENAASSAIAPTGVVLDIGCGIRPMTYFEPKVHLCLEPFEQYVAILRQRFARAPGVIVLRTGALEGLTLLADRSVDSIFLLDVIEHMPKDIGWRVLAECERVAQRQIVITTPLGFMPQTHEPGEVDGWGVTYNKLQDHLSGWEPHEFGEGWRFLVCPTYHLSDAKGRPLEKPFGSFYAIMDIAPKLKIAKAKPVFIGATIPPAPIDGNIREDLLELVSGYDQSAFRILSAYDGRPYCPYYKISHLLEFSTKRLDSDYHHVHFPKGWAELTANPPALEKLAPRFVRFLAPLVRACWANRQNPVVLCDFAPAETLLAYYLALAARTKTIFLCSPKQPLAAISRLFEQLPHQRVDLADGVDNARAAILDQKPPALASRLRFFREISNGPMARCGLLLRLRNFMRLRFLTD